MTQAGRAIEVCGGDYEHVLGLGDAGGAQGPALAYKVSPLGELGRTVLGGGAFHVAEYSLANFIMLKARGDPPLTAIPVFPSRAFRNLAVYVPRDSPLHDPCELAGRRVGVSEFAMTTAIWTRGYLQEAHGLRASQVEWLTGPKPRFETPPGIRAQSTTEDLEALLEAGRIDALMAGKPKDLQRPIAERRLRPLVADTARIERQWFDDTGLFPIMHTVVLHADVARDAAVPRRVFEAYAQAKRTALTRRLGSTLLPFAERLWDQYGPPGRPDPYQHGLTDLNRRNIATLARYLREQGFIAREPEVETLFAPGSAQWTDG